MYSSKLQKYATKIINNIDSNGRLNNRYLYKYNKYKQFGGTEILRQNMELIQKVEEKIATICNKKINIANEVTEIVYDPEHIALNETSAIKLITLLLYKNEKMPPNATTIQINELKNQKNLKDNILSIMQKYKFYYGCRYHKIYFNAQINNIDMFRFYFDPIEACKIVLKRTNYKNIQRLDNEINTTIQRMKDHHVMNKRLDDTSMQLNVDKQQIFDKLNKLNIKYNQLNISTSATAQTKVEEEALKIQIEQLLIEFNKKKIELHEITKKKNKIDRDYDRASELIHSKKLNIKLLNILTYGIDEVKHNDKIKEIDRQITENDREMKRIKSNADMKHKLFFLIKENNILEQKKIVLVEEDIENNEIFDQINKIIESYKIIYTGNNLTTLLQKYNMILDTKRTDDEIMNESMEQQDMGYKLEDYLYGQIVEGNKEFNNVLYKNITSPSLSKSGNVKGEFDLLIGQANGNDTLTPYKIYDIKNNGNAVITDVEGFNAALNMMELDRADRKIDLNINNKKITLDYQPDAIKKGYLYNKPFIFSSYLHGAMFPSLINYLYEKDDLTIDDRINIIKSIELIEKDQVNLDKPYHIYRLKFKYLTRELKDLDKYIKKSIDESLKKIEKLNEYDIRQCQIPNL